MSTNFRLPFIESRLLERTLIGREEPEVSEERKSEHRSNLASELKKKLTNKISSRRLYKLQAKTLVDTRCTKKVLKFTD